MIPTSGRLRWQLMLSHLAAIAFTIVSLVAAVVLIASNTFMSHASSPGDPSQDARMIARAVGGLVARGEPGELDIVLRSLARGDLRVLDPPGAFAPEQAQRFTWFWSPLRGVNYIVITGRDGQTLASSEPAGAAFSPSERAEWRALAQRALADVRDPRQLALSLPGESPAALGAYPVLDQRGRPIAAVIVAEDIPPPALASGFWQGLAFFGAASLALLVAASVFALVSSSLIAFLLSRRLVRRLERLGGVAGALADGDLSQRVEEGRPDEVGQLARQFNYMADRLATMVAELESAKARTEAALHAKRELVANVSHELRTPLALIRGYVESLLIRGEDKSKGRDVEHLSVIQREVEHLGRLIDDLFTLSTAEAGALPLELAPLALGDVVAEVASAISPIARRERQISIVVQIDPDLPLVLADRRRVAQVLGNLVRNALRHTPEGGLIAVRAECHTGRVSVTVEDTGEGITSDRLSHVFERFYRGDEARDRDSGGAGLGLAIVRELVEAMGGDVSVESVVGRGSRFTFSLPLALPD